MNDETDNARNQAAAQMRSVAAMVAALNCDYDRLEELKDSRALFSVGRNMPGYMPDNDPARCGTIREAFVSLAEDMENEADEMDDSRTHADIGGGSSPSWPVGGNYPAELREQAEKLRAESQRIRKGEPRTMPDEYGRTIGDTHYWIAALAGADQFESPEDAEEFAELAEAAGDCEDEDEARQRIHEDALSVQVRSGWHAPGESAGPEEFEILLCTGGPAVRIVGDLDEHGQPSRPRLQYQDWGTPWTEYNGEAIDREALQTYCEQFYFGEGA